MIKILIWVIFTAVLLLTACDENLFKTEEEVEAPQVGDIQSILADFSLNAGDTTKFWITPTNRDAGPFNYQWTATNGEFIYTTDWDTAYRRAPLEGGESIIGVEVSNSEKSVTKTKQIIVISLTNPVVSILSPTSGSYLVQFESIELRAEASHDHDIYSVEFFVNDNLISIVGGNSSNIYAINWTNTAPAGLAEIKVRATAQITATINTDSIFVNIEGVVPGKRE